MKINKIYILLPFFATILSMYSCSDVLDSAPAGRITMADVFADNDKTGAFLNSCYDALPQKGMNYYYSTRGPVDWCDDSWDADDISVSVVGSGMWYNGTISSSGNATMWSGSYWNIYWTRIRNCNTFLQNIATAKVTSEIDRDRWTAEAHLLRAYYYEELLSWYGCALPIETVPYNLAQDFSKVKRSSYYDVVKFINADCDTALTSVNLPWRITIPGENGRVTKALAEALKSRTILFAASPLYNAGQNHWDEAYTTTKACLAALDGNDYELYHTMNNSSIYSNATACFPDNDGRSNYSAIYNEYFTNNFAISPTPQDKESIFQSRNSAWQDWLYDGIGAQYGYKTGTCPTQELVDAFETYDGQPILDLANPYLDEMHEKPNLNASNTTYNEQNPYVKRDPRFYADIYYNGSKRYTYWNFAEPIGSVENYPAAAGYRYRIIATWNGEPKTGLSQNARMMTRTGYYQRKFYHPTTNQQASVLEPKTKLFRLAEAILNFAEAAAEDGHLDEARAAVNRTRERVGMPDITETDQAKLILRIHNERRVEMAMEENRYFDVRRWQKPDGDLSKTDKWITAANIKMTHVGTTFTYTYSRIPVRGELSPRLCYSNKFLTQPLDLDEANLMQSLTGDTWQNPGW